MADLGTDDALAVDFDNVDDFEAKAEEAIVVFGVTVKRRLFIFTNAGDVVFAGSKGGST
jgi:hypothetical protein